MTFTPITIYFLYFIFSRPETQLCTPENRTDTCTEEQWQPVCALYTGPDCQSPTGFCYRTLLRTCDACLDSDILGYAPGECEEPTFPKICNKEQQDTSSSTINEDSSPVCGYSRISRSERLRGKSSVSKSYSSALEACSSDNTVFNMHGKCKDASEIGVCKKTRVQHQCTLENSGEHLCAYYHGGDCTEKLCRKTITDDACNVCVDSSVLFFVKGDCEYVEPVSEDVEELILDDSSDGQELPVPELEAVLQDDGTYVYTEVKEEIDDVEEQDNIPELEAVIQEDGNTVYEPVEPVTPKEDGFLNKVIAAGSHIPELEAVMQEDGTYVYEEVESDKEEIDDVVPQEYIPELEAVVQEDGSVVYEEVPVEEDGVLLCVEVATPTEEVEPLVPSEVVHREDVEPQSEVAQQVETIETRLLVEPDN